LAHPPGAPRGALERFCQRVLTEVADLASQSGKSFHDRYIEIYRLLQRRDRELARAFDAPRRSQAVAHLAAMSALGLLEPDELLRFSAATRESVAAVMEMFQPRSRRRR
jgi:hypothetical protein